MKRKPSNPSFSSQTSCPQQSVQQQPSRPQQSNAGHTNKEKKNRRRPNNKGKGHTHTVDGKDLVGLFASPVVASSRSAPRTTPPLGSSPERPTSSLPALLNLGARPYVPDHHMTRPVVQVESPNSLYPEFNRALTLLWDLGLAPTPKRVQILESGGLGKRAARSSNVAPGDARLWPTNQSAEMHQHLSLPPLPQHLRHETKHRVARLAYKDKQCHSQRSPCRHPGAGHQSPSTTTSQPRNLTARQLSQPPLLPCRAPHSLSNRTCGQGFGYPLQVPDSPHLAV
jgi:hypothetical protein